MSSTSSERQPNHPPSVRQVHLTADRLTCEKKELEHELYLPPQKGSLTSSSKCPPVSLNSELTSRPVSWN